jgi:hypothetical protein
MEKVTLEMILRDVAQHTYAATALLMVEAFNAGAALHLVMTKNERENHLTAFFWDATKPITPESKGTA